MRARRVIRRAVDFGLGLGPGSGEGATGVFVLGMHRSGTSALARIVNLVGVPLGSDGDDDFSPDDSNPSGYWESRQLAFFQDRLLESVRTSSTRSFSASPWYFSASGSSPARRASRARRS